MLWNVLTIPEDSIKTLKSLKNKNYNQYEKKIEKYMREHIAINKFNFSKEQGIMVGDVLVNSVESYLECIELAPYFKDGGKEIKLFDVQFFEWEGPLGILTNDRMYFKFYYPKLGGNCLMKKEHTRK